MFLISQPKTAIQLVQWIIKQSQNKLLIPGNLLRTLSIEVTTSIAAAFSMQVTFRV